METANDDSKSKMEDYAVLELLGRGSFGAAFVVLHKTENKKYVLKKIHLSKQTEKFRSKAFQEMNLIAKLRHPYILEYKDAWVEKGSCICIVTNYCELGNISDIIRKARRAYFSEEKICKWLTQLLLAIDYLHSNRVLHRDLKLSNIFVTKENDIRLGDFGLAKLLNEEGLGSSVVGTPNYMCPELLENMPYGYKSDIWSLGCCTFEIAAHQQAFRAPDMTGLINKINKCLISPMPIVYSSTLKQIIKTMLRKSPEHRPTAAELLRHPHLQPFLLRCHNLSTVFLPVKSPSPNNGKETTKRPSSSSPDGGKDYREKEVKLKQRELLPLFDESTNMQYPNLLDGDVLIEDILETKRVDPTSYSGKISHDSEDSKSGDTSETTACNGDDHDYCDSSSLQESIYTMNAMKKPPNALSEKQEEYSFKNATKLGKVDSEETDESLCIPKVTEETKTDVEDPIVEKCSKITMTDTVYSDNVVSHFDENIPSIKDNVRSEVAAETRSSSSVEEDTVCSDNVVSHLNENMPLIKDNVRAEVDAEPRSSSSVEEDTVCSDNVDAEPRNSSSVEENTGSCSGVPPDGMRTEDAENSADKEPVKIKEDISSVTRETEKEMSVDPLSDIRAAISSGGSNGKLDTPGSHRAEALESLLELCARLLKQDKFDELSGVLKAFGEDGVSSRETAILLTKTLMNAQKLAKDS